MAITVVDLGELGQFMCTPDPFLQPVNGDVTVRRVSRVVRTVSMYCGERQQWVLKLVDSPLGRTGMDAFLPYADHVAAKHLDTSDQFYQFRKGLPQ